MTQVHDAFGVGMNESIPMPPGGSGGGFGGTTENGPYAAAAGPLRWRGVEGSRSGFDLGGLVEMQARSYDPSTGRFLQPDSLPMASMTTQGMNRYIYCENDPVNRSDPSGKYSGAPAVSSGWSAVYVAVGIAMVAAAAIITIGAYSNPVSAVAGVALSALVVAAIMKGLSLILEGLAMSPTYSSAERCYLHQRAMDLNLAAEMFALGALPFAQGYTLVAAIVASLGNLVPSFNGVFADGSGARWPAKRLLDVPTRRDRFC